jgi:hypothetical protein
MSERKHEITIGVEVDYGQRGDVPFNDTGIQGMIDEVIRSNDCPGNASGKCPLEGEIGIFYDGGIGEPDDHVVNFICRACIEPKRIIEIGETFARLYDRALEPIESALADARERQDTPLDGGFGFSPIT